MKAHPPVPTDIWRRLLDFLHDERSGTIALRVHRGRVQHAVISEQVPAKGKRARKADVLESRP